MTNLNEVEHKDKYKIEFWSFRTMLLKKRWNWRVKADNGQTILYSNQAYSNKQDMLDVIYNMRFSQTSNWDVVDLDDRA